MCIFTSVTALSIRTSLLLNLKVFLTRIFSGTEEVCGPKGPPLMTEDTLYVTREPTPEPKSIPSGLDSH